MFHRTICGANWSLRAFLVWLSQEISRCYWVCMAEKDSDLGVAVWRPESSMDAVGIASLLEQDGIDHLLERNRDTAYPGVADRNRPWATIWVQQADAKKAKSLIETWKSQPAPSESDIPWQQGTPSDGEAQPDGQVLWKFLFIASVLVNMWLVTRIP